MSGRDRHLFDDGDDDDDKEDEKEEDDVYMYPVDINRDERADYRATYHASKASE